jgi:hypothetical protein
MSRFICVTDNEYYRVLEKNEKLEWKEDVIHVMLQDDELNLVDALMLCEFRCEQKEKRREEIKRIEETKEPRKLIDRLLAKDALMESYLEKNIILKARLRKVERLLKKKPGILQETPSTGLLKKIELIEHEKNNVQQKLDELRVVLATLDEESLVVKKVQNFSIQEFKKKEWLHPSEGGILAVVHPDVASDEILDRMNGKIILTDHVPKDKTRDKNYMIFMKLTELNAEDFENFLVLKRGDLDRELKARTIFSNIIEEYKKERQTAIR